MPPSPVPGRGAPLRLLVLVNHYAPDRGGGGATYTDMCEALAARGVEVSVIAPVPHYPEWTDKADRNGLRLWRYKARGVDVTRYGIFIPRHPRQLLQRLLFEVTSILSLLRLVPAARRADAVMVFCPEFGPVVIAALMRALFRKPLWLNIQDITSDAARVTGMVSAGPIARLLSGIERMTFNRADLWSTISPVMMRRVAPMRTRGQPLVFVPNWADADFLKHVVGHAPDRSAPGHTVRLLYAGNIGRKQDLLAFCQILAASDADFVFRIFGAGGAAGEVEAFVRSSGDPRFSFGPFMPSDQLARELLSADLYVITERARSGGSFFPSKLVNAMAAGTPVLAVCDRDGPLGEEMLTAEPGPLLEWQDVGTAPTLIGAIAADRGRLTAWRENGLRRADYYARDVIVDGIHARLRDLAEGRPAASEEP